MRIIVYGNPVDGLQFLGPFPDGFDVHYRHTESLGEWWFAELTTPNPTIEIAELTETEASTSTAKRSRT